MSVEIASWIFWALMAYAGVGLIFAIAFVTRGANAIDPVARDGTWGFRLLILPGSAALWPLLLTRWLRGSHAPEERSAHRLAAKAAAGRGASR